jgi:hypothetical protein
VYLGLDHELGFIGVGLEFWGLRTLMEIYMNNVRYSNMKEWKERYMVEACNCINGDTQLQEENRNKTGNKLSA